MEQREIKFRQPLRNPDGSFREWFYWGFIDGTFISPAMQLNAIDTRKESQQFSGLTDKADKEIYLGDFIRYRKPIRTTQTHYGDNIPNGKYTEPMEPAIETKEFEIVFNDGCFCVDDEGSGYVPITWLVTQWDEFNIKEAIAIRNSIWDDPEEGDLQYLLQEYKLKDAKELADYVSGIEVIGNICEQAQQPA